LANLGLTAAYACPYVFFRGITEAALPSLKHLAWVSCIFSHLTFLRLLKFYFTHFMLPSVTQNFVRQRRNIEFTTRNFKA